MATFLPQAYFNSDKQIRYFDTFSVLGFPQQSSIPRVPPAIRNPDSKCPSKGHYGWKEGCDQDDHSSRSG